MNTPNTRCPVCGFEIFRGVCKCSAPVPEAPAFHRRRTDEPTTKLLDASIAALRNDPAAKRAKRDAQVELHVTCFQGTYTIQANGRTVEQGDGDADFAIKRATQRGADIRLKLGKTVTIKYE